MTARRFRNRAAVLLASCFALYLALEAAGVGLSFAYYAAAFFVGWCGLWWRSERQDGSENNQKRSIEMDEAEVVKLMESSATEEEWAQNADTVKARCGGGYPSFWDDQIHISTVRALN